MEALDVTGCPECGAPAEVVARFELLSTAGPVEHVKVVCAQRHWFMQLAERCPGAIPVETPIGTSVR
jgi:hypothetical protein